MQFCSLKIFINTSYSAERCPKKTKHLLVFLLKPSAYSLPGARGSKPEHLTGTKPKGETTDLPRKYERIVNLNSFS